MIDTVVKLRTNFETDDVDEILLQMQNSELQVFIDYIQAAQDLLTTGDLATLQEHFNQGLQVLDQIQHITRILEEDPNSVLMQMEEERLVGLLRLMFRQAGLL